VTGLINSLFRVFLLVAQLLNSLWWSRGSVNIVEGRSYPPYSFNLF